jgi:hypothetical protein
MVEPSDPALARISLLTVLPTPHQRHSQFPKRSRSEATFHRLRHSRSNKGPASFPLSGTLLHYCVSIILYSPHGIEYRICRLFPSKSDKRHCRCSILVRSSGRRPTRSTNQDLFWMTFDTNQLDLSSDVPRKYSPIDRAGLCFHALGTQPEANVTPERSQGRQKPAIEQSCLP